MRTGLLKYEWLEDNTIIDYNRKTITINDNQFPIFCQFLEELDMTPSMSLTDIAHEIFDYSDFYVKVVEDDDSTRWYAYNVCGELTRYVDGQGNWYDRFEMNPNLVTNIENLKTYMK